MGPEILFPLFYSKSIFMHEYPTKNKKRHYRESSIKPPGAYLILDNAEGGLLGRGTYSQSQLTRIYMIALSVLLPHILRIQHKILQLHCIHLTQSFIQNHIRINMRTCLKAV